MPPVDRNKPIRADSSDSQYSLVEFMREFPDDAACLEWLWRNRYSPDGEHAHCPTCEKERSFKRYPTSQQRQSWTCTGCGYHLHPTAGTVFHKSSTSLHLWFYAMYLMTSTRCGISAKQIERELGVTYKTAWRMAHLIRHELMADDGTPLKGTVEVDETYIGGKRRDGRTGRPGPGSSKVAVMGMAERSGRVIARKIPDAKGKTLIPLVNQHVMPRSIVLHRRMEALSRSWAVGLLPRPRSPRVESVREWGCSHQHDRRLLVAREARDRWRLPRRLV